MLWYHDSRVTSRPRQAAPALSGRRRWKSDRIGLLTSHRIHRTPPPVVLSVSASNPDNNRTGRDTTPELVDRSPEPVLSTPAALCAEFVGIYREDGRRNNHRFSGCFYPQCLSQPGSRMSRQQPPQQHRTPLKYTDSAVEVKSKVSGG